MISPIVVSDSISLNQNQEKVLSQNSLRNPSRTPALLDEVRFFITTSGGSGFSTPEAVVRVRFKLGTIPISNDLTPIWLYGKGYSLAETRPVDTGSSIIGYRARWKLPRPLWIPGGELFTPHVQYIPFTGNTTSPTSVTLRITYKMRSLPSKGRNPDVVFLPWVARYIPAAQVGGTVANTLLDSVESDLFNPFNEELHVQRFVGQCRTDGGRSAGDERSTLTLVRMVDSNGQIVVRDAAKFNHLFSEADGFAWNVRGARLAPHGFYKVTLETDYSGVAGTSQVQPMISMIGYRELPFWKVW